MTEGMTDVVRVAHVLDAISEVEKYLDGVAYDDFLANSEKRYATAQNDLPILKQQFSEA